MTRERRKRGSCCGATSSFMSVGSFTVAAVSYFKKKKRSDAAMTTFPIDRSVGEPGQLMSAMCRLRRPVGVGGWPDPPQSPHCVMQLVTCGEVQSCRRGFLTTPAAAGGGGSSPCRRCLRCRELSHQPVLHPSHRKISATASLLGRQCVIFHSAERGEETSRVRDGRLVFHNR